MAVCPVADVWYHLVAVYDGTNASLYVNGVPSGAPQPVAGYVPNVGGPFSVGARSDGSFWFAGYADEVALFTHALSGATIQNHCHYGTNATPSQTYNSLVLARNPILYYRPG